MNASNWFKFTAGIAALATIATVVAPAAPAHAGPFTNGNLVVEQLTGTSGNATPINILEYTKSGSSVQTIAFPSALANQQTDSASATSNGYINTYNGYLSVPGQNLAASAAGANASNTKVNSILDTSGTVVTRTLFPTSGTMPYTSNNYRSSIATSGSTFYAAGTGSPATTGGIWYNDGTSFIQVSSTATGQPTNMRVVEIYNNQLYATSGASTGYGIWAIGSGLPTTAGNASTLLFNSSITGSASPYGFMMFSTGGQGAGVLDLAYIADDRTTLGGGLQKWTLSGTTWTNSWSLFVSGTPTGSNTLRSGTATNFAGLRGLAGTYDSVLGAYSLYATTTETSNNRLISILDTGTATPSTYTTLGQAGTNQVFRGVDLSPVAVPEPSTYAIAAMATLGMADLIRRRRRAGNLDG